MKCSIGILVALFAKGIFAVQVVSPLTSPSGHFVGFQKLSKVTSGGINLANVGCPAKQPGHPLNKMLLQKTSASWQPEVEGILDEFATPEAAPHAEPEAPYQPQKHVVQDPDTEDGATKTSAERERATAANTAAWASSAVIDTYSSTMDTATKAMKAAEETGAWVPPVPVHLAASRASTGFKPDKEVQWAGASVVTSMDTATKTSAASVVTSMDTATKTSAAQQDQATSATAVNGQSDHWAMHWGCVKSCGAVPVDSMCVTECEVCQYQCIDNNMPGDSPAITEGVIDIKKCQAECSRSSKQNVKKVYSEKPKKKEKKVEAFTISDYLKPEVEDVEVVLPMKAIAKNADDLKDFGDHYVAKPTLDAPRTLIRKSQTDTDGFGDQIAAKALASEFEPIDNFGVQHVTPKPTTTTPKPLKPIVKKGLTVDTDEFGEQAVVVKTTTTPKPLKAIVKKGLTVDTDPFGEQAVARKKAIAKKVEEGKEPKEVEEEVVKEEKEEKEVKEAKEVEEEVVRIKNKKASNPSGGLPPLEGFMSNCLLHLEGLIQMIDHSYTDMNIETVLTNECLLEKDIPNSCDTGFLRTQHCTDFAGDLHKARMYELRTGSDKKYKALCEAYWDLQMNPPAPVKLVKASKRKTLFDSFSMPNVSTTLHCIMSLTFQYFGLYTLLTIVRTLVAFKYDLIGFQKILETACTTVTYAPMLCVLFLGARMRAIQLSQGETEKHQLPQPWVQTSMILSSTACMAQVVLVVLVGFVSGASKVVTDEEGNLDVSGMADSHPIAVMVLTVARYMVMAMLYGGSAAVVIGIFLMKGPKEIWAGQEPPVSPAVFCTILLASIFFAVYLLVAITKSLFEVSISLRKSQFLIQLEAGATCAKMTVNFAPMLCILFIGARMRALQIDPKNGNPQSWAQNSFYMCTFSVLVQAALVVFLPFVAKGECKRGAVEGDVAFAMENPVIGTILTVVRYLCLLALYGGIGAVVYSIFVIQHPEGAAMTPAVSPAMQCVMNLATQYFLIYGAIFVCATIKTCMSGGLTSNDAEAGHLVVTESETSKCMTTAIAILDSARNTVMFAPMLSILFVGARMRALQLSTQRDGTIPTGAGPQKWVQDGMFLATWAVFLQLVMAMVVPLLTGGKPECDQDGNTKVPAGANKYMAIAAEVIRYTCLVCMYGGAIAVVVGIFIMTPETLQPTANRTLVPSVAVPQPPIPASAEMSLVEISLGEMSSAKMSENSLNLLSLY